MIGTELVSEVRNEIKRLAALKGWRRDTAFEAELVRICLKYGDSPILLKMAVDQIVESWDHCPSPAELRSQIEKTGARPADDPVPRWRREFRGEVRKALLAQEQIGDCRERRDWLDYLQFALSQHPDIVNEERERLGMDKAQVQTMIDFAGTGPRNKSADPMTPAAGFMAGVMQSLNGKNSDADYARLRRNVIRDALQAVADADSNPDPHSRQFWADHLAWAEREHADEVAAIRAEPRP